MAAAFAKVGLLLVLQPARAFQERMPPEHQRGHETIHSKVIGGAVVNGRLVANGEVQVVVDLVAKRDPQTDVVELLSRDIVDGRLTTVVPGGIERRP